MALESVDYSEEKACRILEIVMQDDKSAKEEAQQEVKGDACVDNETAPPMAVPSDSTESAEPIADVVDHEERYDDFLYSLKPLLLHFSVQLNQFAKSQTVALLV